MTKIDPSFRKRLKQHPHDTVRVIVHISAETPDIAARLQERGVILLRRYKLIRALAASCKGESALALLKEPWVEAIEEDRQVFAQKPDAKLPSTGGNDE